MLSVVCTILSEAFKNMYFCSLQKCLTCVHKKECCVNMSFSAPEHYLMIGVLVVLCVHCIYIYIYCRVLLSTVCVDSEVMDRESEVRNLPKQRL